MTMLPILISMMDVSAVARYLEAITDRNDVYDPAIPHPKLDVFESRRGSLRKLSLDRFLAKLEKRLPCHPICFVAACILLQRAAPLPLRPELVHRMFFTALVLAIKAIDDILVHTANLSRILGCSRKELATMEWTLAEAIGFDFKLSEEDLGHFILVLRSHACHAPGPSEETSEEWDEDASSTAGHFS